MGNTVYALPSEISAEQQSLERSERLITYLTPGEYADLEYIANEYDCRIRTLAWVIIADWLAKARNRDLESLRHAKNRGVLVGLVREMRSFQTRPRQDSVAELQKEIDRLDDEDIEYGADFRFTDPGEQG